MLWLVLLAALLHAAWNAGVKHGVGRQLPSAAIFIGAGMVSLPFVFWLPTPETASYPLLAGSVAIHFFYATLLGRVYRAGDFSRNYSLMRGIPPLLTLVLVGLFVGESLTLPQLAGTLVLCLGVLSLAFESGGAAAAGKSTLGWTLLVAIVIAMYTTVDGLGARAAGNAFSFVLWLSAFEALLLAAHVLATQGLSTLRTIMGDWRLTLLGGATTLASYALVLWAMTQAPIALVAAVRESSVIFGMIIGFVVFKERMTAVRVAAVAMVLSGIAIIRLG